jgi:uncharacterized membrane protein
MSISRYVVLTVTALAIVGCKSGSPTAGTFSAESDSLQLTPGQKRDVEVTVHYRLPSNPAAATTVTYKVQVTAPQGWSADPSNWEHSHTMKTTDIGFNETRNLSVTVPADAAQGEHVVKLVISPASEPAQSLDLRFQVVSKPK